MADPIVPNPIGEVKTDVSNNCIDKLRKTWDEIKVVEKRVWWKFWSRVKPSMFSLVHFLINSLDEIIQSVEKIIPVGADKKATVLAVVGALYDYVVVEAMPIWMKPFSGKIRSFILDVVISLAIDWIAGKYHTGVWSNATIKK